MDLPLVAAAVDSVLPVASTVLVVAGALAFLVFRARSQGRAQRSSESRALRSFADLRATRFDLEPWAVPLVAELARAPAVDCRSDEMLRPHEWQGLKRGTYQRRVLSATCPGSAVRHVILIELSAEASNAYALVIEPAPVNRQIEADAADLLQTLAFGDDALDRAWTVRSTEPAYALAVVDIAMRGRLFGIDARGMRLQSQGRALGAVFPVPATIDLVRDRLILVTEFADRIELQARHRPSSP